MEEELATAMRPVPRREESDAETSSASSDAKSPCASAVSASSPTAVNVSMVSPLAKTAVPTAFAVDAVTVPAFAANTWSERSVSLLAIAASPFQPSFEP